MKKLRVSPTNRRAVLVLCSLCAGLSPLALPAPAQAAPRPRLEIWPGQRVLLVLPLKVGPDWNGGSELAEAIQPIVRPELQRALTQTGKFSVTLPYRFDPVLRRAVADKRLSDDVVSALIANPSLQTAQPVYSNLTFNQVAMVADVQLEELRVGGTQKNPTVQLQASGKLYEIGSGVPFRNVVVTSRAFGGRTPAERLQAAAADAFQDIAAQFVMPPEEFQLPMPAAPVTRGGSMTGAMPLTGGAAMGNSSVGTVTPATPSALAPARGSSFVPQLPPAQPPLGLAVPQEPTLAR